MKILIIAVEHYCDQPSGSAKIASDEALELARRGEDVWVMSSGTLGLPEHEVRDGIHLLRYLPERISPWNPNRAFSHQRAADAILSKYLPEVDVVHGHIPLAGLAALKRYGKDVLKCYTIHSPATMEMAIEWRNSTFLRKLTAPAGLTILKQVEGECLRRANVITALSKYTIDCIAQIHGDRIARSVRLIPGWADTSRFSIVEDRVSAKRDLQWPLDRPVLFTLRRMTPRMGLDQLLGATHQLLREGFKFHLVLGGSGPERRRLEKKKDDLGIGNSVTFVGRIEDRILPLAYAACDAFVLPTAELECFGLIILEALSAGRPVLATPVGAIPEILARFDPSWLAQSAKTADIANLLRSFLQGDLPDHPAGSLHNQVREEYERSRVLSEFLATTVGSRERSRVAV